MRRRVEVGQGQAGEEEMVQGKGKQECVEEESLCADFCICKNVCRVVCVRHPGVNLYLPLFSELSASASIPLVQAFPS